MYSTLCTFTQYDDDGEELSFAIFFFSFAIFGRNCEEVLLGTAERKM